MYNVIVNHTANKSKASKVAKKVSRFLKSQGVEFLVYFSESSADITETTQKLCKSGEREFIVVGGDGTLNHFLNGLTDPSKVNFGIIPAGKNNNFARYLNIPLNPIEAVKNIMEHPAVKVDYLKCNQYRAINSICCGAYEIAQQKFISQPADSKLSYKAILKNVLKTYSGLTLSVDSDNLKQKDAAYTALAICNGGFADKGLYISPLSNMHDGLANLIAINYKDAPNLKIDYKELQNGQHIYKHLQSNSWTTFANIKSSTPIDVTLDGELYSFEQLEINVISNGLNIRTKKF